MAKAGERWDEPGSGWLWTAAILLGVGGVMRIFDAIWAFRYHGVLPENFEGAIFGHSLKTYGWVYLVVAIVLMLSAIAVMNGSQVARWVGIVAGAIAAVTSVFWLPYYPVWSLVYAALGIAVLYGLTAYGGESSTA
jgi:hypothetical protein